MLINGKVVNNPSDRCFPLFLPYMTAPHTVVSGVSPLMEASVIESLDATGSLPANVCERGVGSGVMMIVLQPKRSSDVFQPGYTVLSQGEAQIRLGPGTNYALVATITMDRKVQSCRIAAAWTACMPRVSIGGKSTSDR
jgi:hypothetical protein